MASEGDAGGGYDIDAATRRMDVARDAIRAASDVLARALESGYETSGTTDDRKGVEELRGWVMYFIMQEWGYFGNYWDRESFEATWNEGLEWRNADRAGEGSPELPAFNDAVWNAIQNTRAWHKWGPDVLGQTFGENIQADMITEAEEILDERAADGL